MCQTKDGETFSSLCTALNHEDGLEISVEFMQVARRQVQ
jgi:hypothetical protein